jgi:hypothetical protein
VKHVTVKADQAIVTDTVVAGKPPSNTDLAPAILTDAVEKPMPLVEATNQPQLVGDRKQK